MLEPAEAEVIRLYRNGAVIRCPYCGEQHEHPNVKPGKREHRAPGCRLYAPVTLDERGAGYTFTAYREENN